MAWEPYNLDQIAHDLVFARKDYKSKDENVLRQAYKMRTTVAYGLERFWGETLRLSGEEASYWKATWNKLVEMMEIAGITIPNHADPDQQIKELWLDSRDKTIAKQKRDERKVALAVLTQLCDCMIWWTQRYKKA
jgi:hypothetical protein